MSEEERISKFYVSFRNVKIWNLIPEPSSSTADPILKFDFDKYRQFKTSKISKTLDPDWQSWKYEFEYETKWGRRLALKKLKIECYDYHFLSSDVFLGGTEIDLYTLATGPKFHVLTLLDKKGLNVGTLEMDVQFENVSEVEIQITEAYAPDFSLNDASLQLQASMITEGNRKCKTSSEIVKNVEKPTFTKIKPLIVPNLSYLGILGDGIRLKLERVKIAMNECIGIGEFFLTSTIPKKENEEIPFSCKLFHEKSHQVVCTIQGKLEYRNLPYYAQMKEGKNDHGFIKGSVLLPHLPTPKDAIIENANPVPSLSVPPHERRASFTGPAPSLFVPPHDRRSSFTGPAPPLFVPPHDRRSSFTGPVPAFNLPPQSQEPKPDSNINRSPSPSFYGSSPGMNTGGPDPSFRQSPSPPVGESKKKDSLEVHTNPQQINRSPSPSFYGNNVSHPPPPYGPTVQSSASPPPGGVGRSSPPPNYNPYQPSIPQGPPAATKGGPHPGQVPQMIRQGHPPGQIPPAQYNRPPPGQGGPPPPGFYGPPPGRGGPPPPGFYGPPPGRGGPPPGFYGPPPGRGGPPPSGQYGPPPGQGGPPPSGQYGPPPGRGGPPPPGFYGPPPGRGGPPPSGHYGPPPGRGGPPPQGFYGPPPGQYGPPPGQYGPPPGRGGAYLPPEDRK